MLLSTLLSSFGKLITPWLLYRFSAMDQGTPMTRPRTKTYFAMPTHKYHEHAPKEAFHTHGWKHGWGRSGQGANHYAVLPHFIVQKHAISFVHDRPLAL